jgi:hypothetical protein
MNEFMLNGEVKDLPNTLEGNQPESNVDNKESYDPNLEDTIEMQSINLDDTMSFDPEEILENTQEIEVGNENE